MSVRFTLSRNVSAGTWDEWSTWSGCSATCGRGTTSRTRTCQSSDCAGQSLQQESCNTFLCPSPSKYAENMNVKFCERDIMVTEIPITSTHDYNV